LRKPLREWQDHTIKRDFWSEEKPSDNSLDRVSSNSDYHLSALRPSAKGWQVKSPGKNMSYVTKVNVLWLCVLPYM